MATQVYSCTVQIDFEKKDVSIELTKFYDEKLAEIILNDIKNYYEGKNFNIQ